MPLRWLSSSAEKNAAVLLAVVPLERYYRLLRAVLPPSNFLFSALILSAIDLIILNVSMYHLKPETLRDFISTT